MLVSPALDIENAYVWLWHCLAWRVSYFQVLISVLLMGSALVLFTDASGHQWNSPKQGECVVMQLSVGAHCR